MMSKREDHGENATVADVARVLDSIAPRSLAQSWDNVGLLAGDNSAAVRKVMLCIDLTHAVVDEASKAGADFIMAYHPPIFKPISSLVMPSGDTNGIVFRCISERMSIYSMHTSLDAAPGGTSDVLAALVGLGEMDPIEYVPEGGATKYKVVVFVPAGETDKVAEAMFSAGAGAIGDYTHCGFRASGEGSFYGGGSTNPAVGQAGRLERVEEVRFETVVPKGVLHRVISAMRAAHSYEEPAFDIYPLEPTPVEGIGRVGRLMEPTTLGSLAASLKDAVGANCVQIVGSPDSKINRAVILVGAAGSLVFPALRGAGDVVITGEIRHHDALTFHRRGVSAIALGHWASERPVLSALRERLLEQVSGIEVSISEADTDPFSAV